MSHHQDEMKEAISGFGEKAGRFVALTLTDANNFVRDIENGLSENNAEDTALAAHSLKSIMKQIQAKEVGAIAFEMEKNGKEGNLEACRSLLEPLKTAYDETKVFLETLT